VEIGKKKKKKLPFNLFFGGIVGDGKKNKRSREKK